MSKQLPSSGCEWMTDDELDDWKHPSSFLEVDLEYPEHLHDLTMIILLLRNALVLEPSRN